jgi:WG repeat protein
MPIVPKIAGIVSVWLLTCIVVYSFCFSQDTQPEQHEVATTSTSSCTYSGSGTIINCILRDGNGNISISPEVLHDLQFDKHGLAVVREEDSRYLWLYVNRKGRVVISGVPTFDNWADEFSDGVVRTVVDGKYGFANRRGRIVIKPAYDWASRFDHSHAEVCNHCREMCAMPGGAVELQSAPGCDHRIMVGGEWFQIDKKGRIMARLHR